jgi:hypothetical protein
MRSLFNDDWQLDVDRGWPEAHFVVAGLIAQLAGHVGRAGGESGGRLEIGVDEKRSGEHHQRLTADLDFFGFGIFDRFRFERTSPGQLQRDQVFVFGLVVINVKAGHNSDLNVMIGARAVFEHKRIGRSDDDLILLRPSAERQKEDG